MIGMKELGRALLQRREALQLTQRQFGDRVGKDPAYISRLESGRAKETPTPEDVEAMRARKTERGPVATGRYSRSRKRATA